MRDSQRARVYAWERTFHGGSTWQQTMSIEEVEQYVKRVWRAERGRVGLAKRNTPIVVARRGSSATSFGGMVEFGTKCRNRIVALHELAHELNRADRVGGHGPRFVGILIGLNARHLDLDANEMMAKADEMGVKYHVRAIGVVPTHGVVWKLQRALRDEKPMTEMELACWLDVSYMQIRGAAMHLGKLGKARWLRGKLVPQGELVPLPPEPPAAPKAPRKRSTTAVRDLAEQHGIVIDQMGAGAEKAFMVYPPDSLAEDPWEGDHWADDWAAVREMVNTYVKAITTNGRTTT